LQKASILETSRAHMPQQSLPAQAAPSVSRVVCVSFLKTLQRLVACAKRAGIQYVYCIQYKYMHTHIHMHIDIHLHIHIHIHHIHTFSSNNCSVSVSACMSCARARVSRYCCIKIAFPETRSYSPWFQLNGQGFQVILAFRI
jgi:hypothetical protein